MFLAVFPKHLILFILDEWLCSWKDFSSLDIAMTNKELRQYFYAANSSQDSIGKMNNTVAITIRNGEKLANLMKWKEGRLLEITKLCLGHLSHIPFEYCMLGNKCSTLTDLKINYAADVQLQLIIDGNLPNLIKFNVEYCSVVICREALNVTDKVSNIKELALENITYTIFSGRNKVKPVQNATLDDCTKLYLWMAKRCPQLTKLCLNNCQGTRDTNVIPMLHALPALKDFLYRVTLDSFRQVLDNTPASAVEGINGDRQYHLPRITTLDIDIIGEPLPWFVEHVWEVMFQGCDLRDLQTLALSLTYDIPSKYYNRLINFLQEEGHHLKLIYLNIIDTDVLPLLATICKFCTSLEHWELKNFLIKDSAFTDLALPNTLPHLQLLSINSILMSKTTMEMICTSSMASRLMKLCLVYVFELSFEAYHLVAHSFPRLQTLEIVMSYDAISRSNQPKDSDDIRNIVRLFDELFSRQCVFANTIETLCLVVPNARALDWTAGENTSLANELFHDHMLKHWHFSFPALQSFIMVCRINHPHMNSLIMRRLLNCPKLHSIELELREKNKSRNQHDVIKIKNRHEVIRQMREEEESYLLNG